MQNRDRFKFRDVYKCANCNRIYLKHFVAGDDNLLGYQPPAHKCKKLNANCDFHYTGLRDQCTGLSASKSYRGEDHEHLLIYEGDKLLVNKEEVTIVEWVNELSAFRCSLKYCIGYFGVTVFNEDIDIIGTVHDAN